MLTAIGEEVSFRLKGGRRKRVDCPKRAWAMYDDAGKTWPETSLLIAALARQDTRPADEKEVKGFPEQWLGRTYDADISTVTIPPRALTEWKFVGDVERIYYLRRGNVYPNFFKHDFNKPTGVRRLVFLVKGDREVALYKKGNMYRLELGKNPMLSRYGIEFP